jgi:RNA polymerase sigma-70 factor (ECF subfamily)
MDEDALAVAARAAQAAWPQLQAPIDDFIEHVRARAPDAPPPAERCAELYLTFACARGDGAAITALEGRYLAAIVRKLTRRTGSADLAHEAIQIWREILFVAPPGKAPKIADFTGVAPLAGWLMVVAGRVAARFMRKEHRSVPLEDALAARLAGDHNTELAVLERTYGLSVQEALRDTFRACSAADRVLLCYRYIDGCSIDQLAEMKGVHRATAARWLQRLEERLVQDSLRLLAERLGTSPDELVSVLRLIRSQIQLSIRTVLRSAD